MLNNKIERKEDESISFHPTPTQPNSTKLYFYRVSSLPEVAIVWGGKNGKK
jgi:hypothetical protein